jgi:LysM repeat protein
VLDGPVLGALSPETKQTLQQLSVQAQSRMEAYLAEQARLGESPDPIDLAKIRQQTRAELQKVLAPPELEEYLLRYSQNADNLRSELGQLQYFNATSNEFRAIFRATDSFDQQLPLLAGDDPNTVSQRKSIEEQRDNAILLALGPKRYEQYLLMHDPLYRDAVAAANQAGTPEAARTIYEVNVEAALEQRRIQNDSTLTAGQKQVKLKQTELEQLQANTVASGQQLPPEPPPTPQPAPRKTHLVRPGDSIAVVSLIYGVPVGALQAANPNLNLNRLKPGDSIYIPPSPPPPGYVP